RLRDIAIGQDLKHVGTFIQSGKRELTLVVRRHWRQLDERRSSSHDRSGEPSRQCRWSTATGDRDARGCHGLVGSRAGDSAFDAASSLWLLLLKRIQLSLKQKNRERCKR